MNTTRVRFAAFLGAIVVAAGAMTLLQAQTVARATRATGYLSASGTPDVQRIVPVHYPADNRPIAMTELARWAGRTPSTR